jgi:hypothetical protein
MDLNLAPRRIRNILPNRQLKCKDIERGLKQFLHYPCQIIYQNLPKKIDNDAFVSGFLDLHFITHIPVRIKEF